VFHDAASEFPERGDAAASGPADPFVECFACFIDRELEDDAEAFFQVVGPIEGGVCLHDPGELDLLFLGEVLRVLPKRVAGVLHPGGAGAVRAGRCGLRRSAPGASGVAQLGGFPGIVPRRPAHLVEGFGGPFDDMERVSAWLRQRRSTRPRPRKHA
jgi:hypothetical protein